MATRYMGAHMHVNTHKLTAHLHTTMYKLNHKAKPLEAIQIQLCWDVCALLSYTT